MKQLFFSFMEDEPEIDELVQRIDDQRIGRVEFIARKGLANYHYPTMLYVGDIVVCLSPGNHIVTSGGKYFWTKWQRLDVAALAARAQYEALQALYGEGDGA